MIVMVSGGFDPLHVGHLDLLDCAAEIGKVVVVLNSDEWLFRKKGYVVMSWGDRSRILESLRHVFAVTPVTDSDGTVCEALRRIRPHVFLNGGDRTEANHKEADLCEKLGIQQRFDGGQKIRSSSTLIGRLR